MILRQSIPLACMASLLLLQTWYFRKNLYSTGKEHQLQHESCFTFNLSRKEIIHAENKMKSSETKCFSTTFYEPETDEESTKGTHNKSLHRRVRPRQKQLNVFMLVVESLGFTKFIDQMPLTKRVLDEHGVTWFTGMHVRKGSTRENLPSLLFGSPLTYTIKVQGGNYSAIFDLTKKTLQNDAIWRVAQSNAYDTLYGSTACNLLFGLHHIATSDRFIWHDTLKKSSDFMYTFPYGAYYTPSDQYRDCRAYREVRDADSMLRCSSTGPYHHKFFEYYKVFAKNHANSPLFTVAHLLEPHGNYIYWPLDFHTSEFLRWILEKQDTMVLFLGDHAEEGDPLTTPIGLCLPRPLRRVKAKLRRLSSSMILNENFYKFLRKYFESGDIKIAAHAFESEVKQNKCAHHDNLAQCHCESERPKVPIFNMDLVKRAVERIHNYTKGTDACEVLELQEYRNVQMTATEVRMELLFKAGVIFLFTFLPSDAVSIEQLTRYSSQIPCTPENYHPEFCLCNRTAFNIQNALFDRAKARRGKSGGRV